jgi:hypothetical protein
MKKKLILAVTAILFISPFVAASTTTFVNQTQTTESQHITASAFTHTVFIEEGTSKTCSYCPNAAEALYSLYDSGEYPFYFIALITDQNTFSQNKLWIHYRVSAIPTILVDGGAGQYVGSGTTVEQTKQIYRPLIEEMGARSVHPIELTTAVVGHDNAKLDITVTVKNNGSKLYLGFVQSYVTEITSRWENYAGDPYHFGFLDYAIQRLVVLGPQKSRTYTVTWNGAAKHGNLTYPDITDDNIMVITAVSHWLPHVVQEVDYIKTHLAFYVDQTDGTTVE